MQVRDGRQVTLDNGIQVITSPDGSMTTITDNGRVITLATAPDGGVTATVNGKAVSGQSRAVSDAIERVALASQHATPRVWRGGVVRVNGRPLTPDELLAGSAMAGSVATFVALVTLYAFGRFFLRLFRRRPAPVSAAAPATMPNVAPRLERLEHAVESIAVEMERVAEAQRFSARLLSERLPVAVPAAPVPVTAPMRATPPERVTTPH